MDTLLRSGMFVLSALFVFYCIGFLLPFSDEDGGTSASETICGGLLITVSVFELSSVLCVLAGVKLMTCLYIGGGAVIVLFVTSVVLHIGDYGHRVRWWAGHYRFSPYFLPLLAGVLFTAWAAVSMAGKTGSLAAAQMNTDLYKNAAAAFDGATGAALDAISPAALLARWPIGGEFVSLTFGLSPIRLIRIGYPVLIIILSSLIVYRLGWHLFGQSKGKATLLTLLSILSLFFFRTAYSPEGLLFGEGGSGEAAFVHVIVPAVLLLSICIYETRECGRHVFLLFLAGGAGLFTCETAVYLMPFLILSSGLAAVLLSRNWKKIVPVLGCVIIPLAAFALQYFVSGIPVNG
jgi:hypothetical protein